MRLGTCFRMARAVLASPANAKGACRVLQGVAGCSRALQGVAGCCRMLQHVAACCSVLQCVAVCCCALHCVAVCCSALQCVAACFAAQPVSEWHAQFWHPRQKLRQSAGVPVCPLQGLNCVTMCVAVCVSVYVAVASISRCAGVPFPGLKLCCGVCCSVCCSMCCNCAM